MNFEHLFTELGQRRIRIALTGANGGFGRTFLAQCRYVPHVDLVALVDRDVEGLRATLLKMGYPEAALRVCASASDVIAARATPPDSGTIDAKSLDVRAADVSAPRGTILLVPEPDWLDDVPLDIVVEATGVPETSVRIAERALRRRVHVGMVTKETDSVVGPWLNDLAKANGVVYTTVDGDQPANLVGLVTWARVLGFDVVAAGKSSEYDFIYNAQHGEVSHNGITRKVEGLDALWHLPADPESTLAARSQALAAFPQSATPDYCEMGVVANSTGLLPSCEALSYPTCRIAELADVFIPIEDGGVLTRTGVVDVFNCLRRNDEASFGGGVFVIVRCTDDAVWKLLEEKGHVVGRNRKYACIYTPFHLMGLESLTTVYSAVLHGRSSGSADQRRHSVMVARAKRDLAAGETLTMGGHMHDIECAVARLVPATEAGDAAPYYLAANKRLVQSVVKGKCIPVGALDLEGSALYRGWLQMTVGI